MPFQNGFSLNNDHSLRQQSNTQVLSVSNLDGGILCFQIKRSGVWPLVNKDIT
jgi:hypothetical protein